MQPETPDTAPHGTYAALIAHRARKEEPCEICRRAGALYMKAYRNRDKCAPGLGWPLRSTPIVRVRRRDARAL